MTVKRATITIDDVKKNPVVATLVERADRVLEQIGYTEHGNRHCSLAASIAYNKTGAFEQ